jgi:hypothetical protein
MIQNPSHKPLIFMVDAWHPTHLEARAEEVRTGMRGARCYD